MTGTNDLKDEIKNLSITGITEQQVIYRLEQLQKEVKELKESRDYWQKRHDEISRKFNAFRESIKSIIVLVD